MKKTMASRFFICLHSTNEVFDQELIYCHVESQTLNNALKHSFVAYPLFKTMFTEVSH